MAFTHQLTALLVCVITSVSVDAMGQIPLTHSSPKAQAPSDSDKLIATIPALNAADESLSSFEFQGKLPSPFLPTEPIDARVAWNRETGSSMILSSSRTGTPLIWAAKGEACIFDCSSSMVTVIRGVHPHVTFRTLNGQVDYLYRLHAKEVRHNIDLQSFAHAYAPNQLSASNNSGLTLSGVSPSGRSRIRLSYGATPKLCFNGFQITTADSARTLLNSIDKLEINKPLSAPLTQRPSDLLEENGVEIAEATDVSIVGLYRIAQAMKRSLVLHIAVEQPGYQDDVSRMIEFMDVDWDNCSRNYKKVAPALQSISKDLELAEPRLAKRPN